MTKDNRKGSPPFVNGHSRTSIPEANDVIHLLLPQSHYEYFQKHGYVIYCHCQLPGLTLDPYDRPHYYIYSFRVFPTVYPRAGTFKCYRCGQLFNLEYV